MNTINLMIVDDSGINRSLLKLLFKVSNNYKVISEANDGYQAIDLLRSNPDIDVIIMDIDMPNMNGIDCTKRIKEFAPKIKVLCNSFHADANYIQEMIEAGASGYITKDCSLDCYQQAIHTVYNHGIYLTENINEETYKEVYNHLKVTLIKKEC